MSTKKQCHGHLLSTAAALWQRLSCRHHQLLYGINAIFSVVGACPGCGHRQRSALKVCGHVVDLQRGGCLRRKRLVVKFDQDYYQQDELHGGAVLPRDHQDELYV